MYASSSSLADDFIIACRTGKKLTSAEDFIWECETGKKNANRRAKEGIISSFIPSNNSPVDRNRSSSYRSASPSYKRKRSPSYEGERSRERGRSYKREKSLYKNDKSRYDRCSSHLQEIRVESASYKSARSSLDTHERTSLHNRRSPSKMHKRSRSCHRCPSEKEKYPSYKHVTDSQSITNNDIKHVSKSASLHNKMEAKDYNDTDSIYSCRSRRNNGNKSGYNCVSRASKKDTSKERSVLCGTSVDLSRSQSAVESTTNRNGTKISSQNLLKKISRALNSFNKRNQKHKLQAQIDNIPMLLDKWKVNKCENENKIARNIEKCAEIDSDELLNSTEQRWVRSAPAELHYKQNKKSAISMGRKKCIKLCAKFQQLLNRITDIRLSRPKYEAPVRRRKINISGLKSDESDSEHSAVENRIEEHSNIIMELERKQKHPDRLHAELWYNDPGELNDGPVCRCTAKSSKCGVRHNIYVGEEKIPLCNPNSNNADRLFHYRITVSPPTNFLIKTPTVINYDDHEYIFEGFSLFSHYQIPKLPNCKVIRFNINYTVLYVAEKIPNNFTICELQLFYKYFFYEILELVDFDLYPPNGTDGCPMFHFMPRFVRELPENGTEILPMCKVLNFLLKNYQPLIREDDLEEIHKMDVNQWQEKIENLKGMIVTKPGWKPCSLRVDQIDRDISTHPGNLYPDIVHFGIRPPQLSYAGNKKYQRLWRSYVKYRHLLANLPKPSSKEKIELQYKEEMLNEIKAKSKLKRGITVVLSSEGFMKTGIMCDIVQHALLLPVLVCHLRFHRSLQCLESQMKYKFKNRYLLQMALTHPSYREHFGTNPDHVRNILTNCGIRQPEYGDRRIHYMNTRKRGINTLINIMSRFGRNAEMQSTITHNERLEFLGDAVIEFITSIHLFFLFPDIEEGGLATYRAAVVQNQNLTLLAKVLNLEKYMLFAHGSDLCHDLELRHAMANCFEALIASIYLDGGIQVADRVFSDTFLDHEKDLLPIWKNYPKHVLQEQEPQGDRKWIATCPVLEKLTKLEKSVGITFTHIRLLARAFTDRSIGYMNLTLGSNQRMEFLGDTVLQLICSTYLYKHFPDHHEGHLSLLRSSLVNNRTQSIISDDLSLACYAMYANPKCVYKVKDRADLLEAFIGALYIDKGLVYCEEFCKVCFFPRLQEFIVNQNWNDPKSKLQQCCLTLRSVEGQEPDIPLYKTIECKGPTNGRVYTIAVFFKGERTIECKGPTNGRVYTVAVYFKGERLASARGHNIQQAEMNAAKKALSISRDLFPQLSHQRRQISKNIKYNENLKSISVHESKPNRRVSQWVSEKNSNDDDIPVTSTMNDLLKRHQRKKLLLENNKEQNLPNQQLHVMEKQKLEDKDKNSLENDFSSQLRHQQREMFKNTKINQNLQSISIYESKLNHTVGSKLDTEECSNDNNDPKSSTMNDVLKKHEMEKQKLGDRDKHSLQNDFSPQSKISENVIINQNLKSISIDESKPNLTVSQLDTGECSNDDDVTRTSTRNDLKKHRGKKLLLENNKEQNSSSQSACLIEKRQLDDKDKHSLKNDFSLELSHQQREASKNIKINPNLKSISIHESTPKLTINHLDTDQCSDDDNKNSNDDDIPVTSTMNDILIKHHRKKLLLENNKEQVIPNQHVYLMEKQKLDDKDKHSLHNEFSFQLKHEQHEISENTKINENLKSISIYESKPNHIVNSKLDTEDCSNDDIPMNDLLKKQHMLKLLLENTEEEEEENVSQDVHLMEKQKLDDSNKHSSQNDFFPELSHQRRKISKNMKFNRKLRSKSVHESKPTRRVSQCYSQKNSNDDGIPITSTMNNLLKRHQRKKLLLENDKEQNLPNQKVHVMEEQKLDDKDKNSLQNDLSSQLKHPQCESSKNIKINQNLKSISIYESKPNHTVCRNLDREDCSNDNDIPKSSTMNDLLNKHRHLQKLLLENTEEQNMNQDVHLMKNRSLTTGINILSKMD